MKSSSGKQAKSNKNAVKVSRSFVTQKQNFEIDFSLIKAPTTRKALNIKVHCFFMAISDVIAENRFESFQSIECHRHLTTNPPALQRAPRSIQIDFSSVYDSLVSQPA